MLLQTPIAITALERHEYLDTAPESLYENPWRPPAEPPSARLLGLIGEAVVQRLVWQHHEYLRGSDIASIAAYGAGFAERVTAFTDFLLLAWRQGRYPADDCCWALDENERDIWLAHLWRAMQQCGFPESAREACWDWLEAFSLHLIDSRRQPPQRRLRSQPTRYPYATLVKLFGNRRPALRPLPAGHA